MSAKALSQPLQIGDLTIRNRVIMAALTRNRNVPVNVPNDTVAVSTLNFSLS
jgi:2,4-dienoyl-CoA reductase-like NADH-dependent reductase (Old Yellow Enzyme family)